MKPNNLTPGEWETDKYGQRFRKVGNIIEYEETITVAGGLTIPISQLENYQKRQREAEEKLKKKAAEELAKQRQFKYCPFTFKAGNTSKCTQSKCALFYQNKCSLAIIADNTHTEINTINTGRCPFSGYGFCVDCALYNNGCAFIRLAASINTKEKEVIINE